MRDTNLLVVIALCTTTALGAVGCAEDDVSFYIQQNQIPEDGCSVATASAGVFLSSGTLDVDIRVGRGYYMFPLVVNNMVPSNKVDGQPERNNLHMRSFDVTLDVGGLALTSAVASELEFAIPKSGMIAPGGEAVYSGVQVISDKLAAELGNQLQTKSGNQPVVLVTMRAVAERSGETRESAEFIFPVTLCYGCLVDFRTAAPASTDKDVFKNACGLPQDSPVTCYKSTSGTAVCLQDKSS